MNFTKYTSYLYLAAASFFISLAFYLAFYFHLPNKLGFPESSLETIYANFDGPNYMVISKCWYQPDCIRQSFSLPQPLEYYPAHFPGYPLLIEYFSLYTSTPKAMLLTAIFGSILFTLVLYSFLKIQLKDNLAFNLSLLSLVFPARLLVIRLVGAPETWFIAFTLLSLIYFHKNRYLISAIFASLALLFKSPGVLLLIPVAILFLKKPNLNYFWYSLVPLTALGIFYFYYLQTGDFWAYFHSGDNIHLALLPYQVFISNHTWINTIWLEDVIYIYLFAVLAMVELQKKFKYQITFLYPAVFTLAAIFIGHRDISRYILPVVPFIFLAYSEFFNQKKFRIIISLIIPAIILYTINFLIGNTAPIADWTPYL